MVLSALDAIERPYQKERAVVDKTGDVQKSSEAQQEERRQIQMRDSGVSTIYSGFFTITAGRDAIMMSFGNQLSPNAVQIEQKTVLSPPNAKRLAVTLAQVIRRYEGDHGEIDISVPQPQKTESSE